MFTYSRQSDVDKEDAIIVRVFGDAAGLPNRDMELTAMQVNLMQCVLFQHWHTSSIIYLYYNAKSACFVTQ